MRGREPPPPPHPPPSSQTGWCGFWSVNRRRLYHPKVPATVSHPDRTDFAPKSTCVPQPIMREWLEEFEAASRRPLAQRLRYAFIKTYKPVMDDAPFRAFATMSEYRAWCEEHLPEWLGYGRVW